MDSFVPTSLCACHLTHSSTSYTQDKAWFSPLGPRWFRGGSEHGQSPHKPPGVYSGFLSQECEMPEEAERGNPEASAAPLPAASLSLASPETLAAFYLHHMTRNHSCAKASSFLWVNVNAPRDPFTAASHHLIILYSG